MSDNEKLNRALEEGETIQWSGVPQPYGLFDESRKSSTIMSVIWASVWGIGTVGGYYASSVSQNTEMKAGIVIFLIAISLLILWIPIADIGKVKKLSYAVTDRKCIIVSKDTDNPIVMRFSDIDDIRLDRGDNGNSHVRIGSAVFKMSPKKLPAMAYRGEFVDQDGKKTYQGMIFYNVRDEEGKAICNLLKTAIHPQNVKTAGTRTEQLVVRAVEGGIAAS